MQRKPLVFSHVQFFRGFEFTSRVSHIHIWLKKRTIHLHTFTPRLCPSETRFLYTLASELLEFSACGKPSCTVALVGNPCHVEPCGPDLVDLVSYQKPAPPQCTRLQIFVGAEMCLRSHVRGWESALPTDLIALSPAQASIKGQYVTEDLGDLFLIVNFSCPIRHVKPS